MSREQLIKALQQLSNAPNQAAAARILQDSPLLTTLDADDQLTNVIGAQYRRDNMPSVCLLTAVRGFLRRYRTGKNLSAPGWSLAAHSPLAHFLALTETDDPDEPLKWGHLALQDLDAQTEPELYGMVQYRLGLYFLIKTEAGGTAAFEPGINHLTTAVHTLAPLPDKASRTLNGRACHNLAKLYLTQPDINRRQNVEQALTLLAQARPLLVQNSREMIDLLILEGDAYLGRIREERLHNIEQGIERYETARQMALETNISSRLHEIEHNLAVAYRIRLYGRPADNYETALNYAEIASQRIDRTTMLAAWAKSTNEQAIILAHRQKGDRSDNLEQAIDLVRQTLTYYQPHAHPDPWSLAHLTLGNLFCDRLAGDKRANYQQAINHFEIVKDSRDPVTNPIGWSEAINNLGTIYADLSQRPYDTHYQQAMACYQQALAVHGPDNLPDRAFRTAVNQGNLAFRFQQWPDAFQAYQTALSAGKILFEASGTRAGRQKELAQNSGLAAKAAFCLLQQDPANPGAAFRQLEQGKARLLMEALTLRDVDLSQLPPSLSQAVKELRQNIRQLEAKLPPSTQKFLQQSDIEAGNRLVQKRREFANLIAEIRQTQPDFLKIEPTEPDFAGLIPVNGAIVAPLITEQGSIAFVIPYGAKTVTAEHIVRLPKGCGADLDRLIEEWITAYMKRSEAFGAWKTAVTHLTNKLWPVIIQPIAEKLTAFKCTKAILIPQGGLQLLPLHAAWHSQNGHRHYFGDDFEISYAPSLSVLALAQKRLAGCDGKNALIAGIDKYKSQNNLTHAVSEAQQIARTFKTVPLLNEQVTRQALLDNAPNNQFLHLACHGKFNWEDTLESALYLANDERLTLNNILSELDLQTMRLVTLSACETGITEFSRLPDEFIGLPTGFMQAGASGVINSLWTVDDNSTSILMGRFYTYLVEEHQTPASALKNAQANLRRLNHDYQEPYFWAAFTFYGI